jgi:hypothetical protein
MTSPLRLGNEEFWLDSTDAAEVQRLCLTDRQAGLSLARRRARKASVTVPMMAMDAAPAPVFGSLHDAAASPPPSQSKRTTPMTAMTKIRIGDAEHFVDASVAREIEYLRGTTAALTAIVQGKVQPPAGQHGTTQSATAHLSDEDFWRAKNAADRDPSTPRGRYIEHLKNAHRNPAGSRG